MATTPPTAVAVTAVPRLPPRPGDANKGNFGRVLVVAGSRGMSGAAVLCASGALRGGAGLVKVAVGSGLLPLICPANPCFMTAPMPEDADGRLAGAGRDMLIGLLRETTAAAVGPGLGQSAELTDLLTAVVLQTDRPLVLDADALNGLAVHTEVLRGRRAPVVLTPHPGEFARLLGTDIPTVQADRQGFAVRFASDHGLVLVLKGHRTVVTDGQRAYVNHTGNPGMATGGSGDVLSGLVAALLAQGLEPFVAAQLGVYLHGLAGDLARDDLGETSLIATDLVDYLPRAFQAHAGSQPHP
jgi:NAD(P)H-hydrate epimerase